MMQWSRVYSPKRPKVRRIVRDDTSSDDGFRLHALRAEVDPSRKSPYKLNNTEPDSVVY